MPDAGTPGGAIYARPKPEQHGDIGWTVWLGITALLALLLVVATLLHAANRQDAAARASEERVLRYALEQLRQSLLREVRDQAWWTEAWRNLVPDPDPAWVADQLGAYAHDDLGLDLVYVFDSDLRTRVAEIDGEPAGDGVGDRVPGVATLLSRTGGNPEEGPEVATAFLRDADGHPVLVAVSPILPDDPAIPVAGSPSFLLFGVRLDRWLATTVVPIVDLPGLRWSPEPPAEGPAIALPDAREHPTGWLVWEPATPGGLLRTLVAPPVLLAGALVLAFALATARAVRRALDAAAASQERFVDMATAMSDWLFETDAEGRIVYVSEGFRRWCPGRDPVAGREHLLDLCEPVSDRALDEVRSWLARRMPFRDLVARVRTPEGERRVRIAARPWQDAAGRFRGYHGAATDVTESFRARAEAEYHARHEPLTGLPNRRLMAERLEDVATRAILEGARAAVFYVDLDGFKRVNDTLGHDAGDLVLLACAERLRACVRDSDLVARVGGDEFVLVVESVGPERARQLAQRIADHLSTPVEVAGRTAEVGCSVGVALLPEDSSDPEELVRLADRAMLAAKRAGRGRVVHIREIRRSTPTEPPPARIPEAGGEAGTGRERPPAPDPGASAGA